GPDGVALVGAKRAWLSVPRRPVLFCRSFEWAVRRILGRKRGRLKMQGDAGTQQTRAHAQRTHSSLAPLSVSSAASEAEEAAAEGIRAQSDSQWHPLNLLQRCGGGGKRWRWGEDKGARARLLQGVPMRAPADASRHRDTDEFLSSLRVARGRFGVEVERRRRGGADVSAHQVGKTAHLEWASAVPSFWGFEAGWRDEAAPHRDGDGAAAARRMFLPSFGWSMSSA
ncbi:hypothetical protein B0H14DRAFT_1238951, partial [Mycena olivaceomarginata]